MTQVQVAFVTHVAASGRHVKYGPALVFEVVPGVLDSQDSPAAHCVEPHENGEAVMGAVPPVPPAPPVSVLLDLQATARAAAVRAMKRSAYVEG